ncbi:M50B-like peptidase [Clostridium pasteurianum DSM 525 = ATCC 6013]|uniref:M50B-like peptidase n=1 Tax=Clostridium pasteurianum DSM 525 = ATCC 6013 TaxID=1262449 RepID=A0A0H3J674_CLOPA|nr:hypothetical protein [Clostridium pasteurianum]AJA46440.1 M50B-like peptidase [Clostridium pasteurianum DSM 525 = ATCC 6013]AJA50428.1 M50B-like peptidase [Clostridium pasteurianum DSM 525 = ATCC 6013]AOZ73874.1 hypothetical protein AQ983_01650 [Clostridium pasteurianum DSM 525 = ATCC 6013]AOZ77671.1 hypothetical protein AQ984_01650 [Clostridium pasteurianum]ELP61015.1 hypothetical protein F502_01120 [Clostridium pasteurianum DSM 525 = ATCC 6013]
MDLFIVVLKRSAAELFYLTALIIIIGLLLGILEKGTNRNMQRAFGIKGIMTFALIGTPIHEIGHAVMCIIFGHKITKMKLIDTNSKTGVLGYVEHSYNPNNIYQRIGNFFIGIGPIISGIFVLLIGLYFLLPESFHLLQNNLRVQGNYNILDKSLITSNVLISITLIKSIFTLSNITKITFWIFIILAFCVSSHIALSTPDIKGALDGFIFLFLVIVVVNFIAMYFNINTYEYISRVGKYNAYAAALLIMALVFSIISYIISYILRLLRRGF